MHAEKWLRQIEKLLNIMDCTEKQRVSFVSFMFQGEVEHWWEAVNDGAKFLREEVVWNFLIKKFNEKYISGMAKDQLTQEFQELKQE